MLSFQTCLPPILPSASVHRTRALNSLPCLAISKKSDSEPDPKPRSNAKPKHRRRKIETSEDEDEEQGETFPTTIPRKPRRGRRSEAAAVEDYVRESLDRTFASIREQNPEIVEKKEEVMKRKVDDDEEDEGFGREKSMVVEEESRDWPLDADVGWGIRASEYFENHPIRNVVGDNGVELDWEGEVEDNWVKEINCLEWESFAFHPSPLLVLVFERYNRASDNWKALKELEKAVKVYWDAKDRLPPRSVKIDINIERDLAYALKVRECPQILFLRGNRILYREKEIRTAEELVPMIAHFYYNAKRPSWIDVKELSPPY
ncbi:thioredoxin-like fold domain-containing protein MRL7, chloroplastic [Prunus avium]|uniref:Thioredoxin-like fold domain-containing protein MRL7, chloroplastic n=1 Tax=Prunus avium TaxID=42229 RepID=A0A6P5SM47_PRUAV|nr:thioredoxin-like fold domain-containing protein MRL7, chloroplastic [Prunus avium]XP_021814849.1 thioredoxin-like fold domain-containing protein MRL7, chloroplastic [Prunus avium]XP_021814850.1 thioredoxin-like fold domain-containing protein MRL7, chloroplastic [Prunus avium]XP_021814851.1 thioredoxin-like fold domain-containing protein MRL7, chloroplastic [Prunus avium]XP_021814852.1 thioredoxin-like fold domain-containing protein MRL7, chloroplastic [Prunus avium]XP_021814853.1 thioredoxi